jgi:hypothetical protein
MKPGDAIEFLKTKEALVLAVTGHPPGQPGFVATLIEAFSKAENLGEVRLINLVTSLKRELDMMMFAALPETGRQEIARVLQGRFGFSHLSQNPDLVIRQILRRRKSPIRTLAEAELIVNALASVSDDSLTAKERTKLKSILRDYESSLPARDAPPGA